MSEQLRLAIVENVRAQLRHGLTSLLIKRLQEGGEIADIAGKIGWTPIKLWGLLQGEWDMTERDLADLLWALSGEMDATMMPWDPL